MSNLTLVAVYFRILSDTTEKWLKTRFQSLVPYRKIISEKSTPLPINAQPQTASFP